MPHFFNNYDDEDASWVAEELLKIKLKIKNMTTKPWYYSSTLWIAVAQALVGVIVAFTSANPALDSVAGIAILKSVLDVFLRLNTTTAISGTETN